MHEDEPRITKLLDNLIDHWIGWDSLEEYYLNELTPDLVTTPFKRDKVEQEILGELQALLKNEDWLQLPRMIAERRRERREKEERRKGLKENKLNRNRETGQKQSHTDVGKKQTKPMFLKKKNKLLTDLRNQFNSDYLRSERFFQEYCSKYIEKTEYEKEKRIFIKSWFRKYVFEGNRNSLHMPDEKQLDAIAAFGEKNILVTARAGSGKTTTLVYRTLFLIKHCKIDPDKILILAFNRKAAFEVRKRLLLLLHPDAESVFESRVVRRKHKSGKGQKNVRSETEDKALEKAAKKLKIRLPHVMTFHALAYALVHPEESILYDDSESDTQILSSVLQEIIDDHLQVPEFRDKIRELMLAHFREDWESIIKGHYEKSREEFLEYRRSVPRESLNGEYLKSYGEKIIADFLFEHDIKYKYEHNFWWGKRNYRPDFTIFKTAKTGIVIEYFGLHGDPDYDEMAEEKKKFWSKQTKWDLIALSAKDLKNTEGKSFQSFLKTNLKNFGIRCVRLSEHEIWSRVRGRAIDRFTKAIVGFISRCRNQSVTPEDLGRLLDNYTSEARSEKGFLRLAKRFYEVYLERLESTGEEDFNGLVQQAADLVRRGKTVFERRSGTGDLSDLQFLLIDEFQDFSNLFYRLLCEIKKQNNTVSLFCVGDDWQAINGFAGSDLRFFKEFEKYIGEAQRINMLRNYRSMREIVDVSNALMFGYGDRATASKKEQGTVLIADLEKFNPTPLEKQQHQGDILTPAILRISNKALHEDKEVILLSRRNGLPYYINYENNSSSKTGGLEGYLQYIRSFFPDEYKKRIGVSTVHKYKGLESSTVIVLDAVERSYPLIHPDWVFSRVLGDTPQKIIQEERRLFYVALTRAIEELVIITNGKSLSQFLQDILKRKSIVPISWNKYFQLKGRETQIVVKVGNSTPDKRKGTYPIKDLLKASGYRWQTTGWLSWTKIYPSKSFSVDQLKSELWSTEATEVEVRIFNENEELLHRYQVNKGNWKREEKSISPDHMLPNNILRIYHN